MFSKNPTSLNCTQHDNSTVGPLGMTKGHSGAMFEDSSARAFKAARRRKWTLVSTLVALAALGIGALAYNRHLENTKRAVASEYLAIEAEMASQTQKFQEQVKAAKEKAASLTPDFSAVGDKFATFAKKYPSEPLGWQASLKASNIYIEGKKFDEAAQLLLPLVGKSQRNFLMQTKIRHVLAGIYAQKGEYDKALVELDLILKSKENPIPAETKLFKAQILFLAGKKEEAGKLLKEIGGDSMSIFDPSFKSLATEATLWASYWGL